MVLGGTIWILLKRFVLNCVVTGSWGEVCVEREVCMCMCPCLACLVVFMCVSGPLVGPVPKITADN